LVTFNTTHISFYVNGLPAGETLDSDVFASNNANDVLIGNGWSGASPTAYDFDGFIDEAAIWNRSMKANEIASFYSSPITPPGIINIKIRNSGEKELNLTTDIDINREIVTGTPDDVFTPNFPEGAVVGPGKSITIQDLGCGSAECRYTLVSGVTATRVQKKC